MKPALIIIDIKNDYFPGGPEAGLQAARAHAGVHAALNGLYAKAQSAAANAEEAAA